MNMLVTGASRGIGRAIARELAASGATVGVHYNSSAGVAERLAEELGHGSRTFKADLADTSAYERLFEEVVDAFGHLDVLVNNAGVAQHAPLDAPINDWLGRWQSTLTVNLTAAGALSREAVRHFRGRGGRRIIFIASRAAFRGDAPDYLAYAASKGGMVALSRSIARGFGKDGVTSFVIAPGYVRTDMAQEFIDAYGEEIAVSDLALPTLTEPEDVAPLVALFASGLADHATGCTVDVNAGSYVH